MGAHEIHGLIANAYARHGFEGGMGFPTSDEYDTARHDGRVENFDQFYHDHIFYKGSVGAHYVVSSVSDLFASLGYEQSYLGFPITDEYYDQGAGYASDFETHSLLTDYVSGRTYGPIHLTFDRNGAVNYQNTYLTNHNPRYICFNGNNCTNFSSQVWHVGAGIPYSFVDFSNTNDRNWIYPEPSNPAIIWSNSFTVAPSFVNHFENTTSSNYNWATVTPVFADPKAPFIPDDLGDAIAYDKGTSASGPIWDHVATEHHWGYGIDKDGQPFNGDWVAQNSYDEVVPWNRYYYQSTGPQQVNQRNHGFLILQANTSWR